MSVHNPALEAFVAAMGSERIVGEVLIRRTAGGLELRHVQDRAAKRDDLRQAELGELRAIAQFTANDAFRPLKSAPNLQKGWWALAKNTAALDLAMQHLYPNFIADWFAAQQEAPPVTNYREFTNRQTGMYRITQMLTDAQAAQVIRAGCHVNFCLKRRLWTVPGLAIDSPDEKSIIPCLEPCALLLEFTRKAMRIEQAEKVSLSSEEAATAVTALEASLKHPDPSVREADFASSANPRRIQLLLEKLRPWTESKRGQDDFEL